jgi:hypothetical protein
MHILCQPNSNPAICLRREVLLLHYLDPPSIFRPSPAQMYPRETQTNTAQQGFVGTDLMLFNF